MDIQNIFQKKLLPITLMLLATTSLFAQKVVRYDLYVKDTLVNYAGKEKRAIAVNGQIPMPTLTFTEGDTAEIVVHNQLKESTSLHWHGVFLPNKEDGVPWLTQKPIEPGTTYTYRFPIIQHGTHWYHSHSGLQEQIGMYGSFVMLKKQNDPTFRKGIDDLPTVPLMISEWTIIIPIISTECCTMPTIGQPLKKMQHSHTQKLFEKGILKQKSRTNGNGCWRWT